MIRSVLIGIINEGKDVRHLLENGEKLDTLLCGQSGCEGSLCLPIKAEGNPLAYVAARSINS